MGRLAKQGKRGAQCSKNTSKGDGDDLNENSSGSGYTSNEATSDKRARMKTLISGPESKSALVVSSKPSKKPKKMDQLQKSDLGKLARVMDLSVEIFYEIASNLTPVDLLNLSRTSRSLRDFLMSKSSKPIWVVCLAATGIPPCPSDMSEPQYANLYFEKDCHACGYPRVERLTDYLRIRLCKGCSDLNLVPGKVLLEEYFGQEAGQMVEVCTLLPWDGMDVSDIARLRSMHPRIRNRSFLKHDFLEVVKAYLQTKSESEERKTFVEDRHKLIDSIAKNSFMLRVKSVAEVAAWQAKRYNDRFWAADELCKKRRSQIREKLHDIGYSYSEIDSLWSMPSDPDCIRVAWTRLVYQPRELTDRIWKSVRPKLEDLIEKKRQFDQLSAGNNHA